MEHSTIKSREDALRVLHRHQAHLLALWGDDADPSLGQHPKAPRGAGWQKHRHSLHVVLAAPVVGLMPASLALVVVDCDGPKSERGADGKLTLAGQAIADRTRDAVEAEANPIFRVRTPSGGWHLYYRMEGAKEYGKRPILIDRGGAAWMRGDIIAGSHDHGAGQVALYDPLGLLRARGRADPSGHFITPLLLDRVFPRKGKADSGAGASGGRQERRAEGPPLDFWLRRAPEYGWRENSNQLEGPCPVCGGDDRFHVSLAPPHLFGCRQCEDGGAILRAVGWKSSAKDNSVATLSTFESVAPLPKRWLIQDWIPQGAVSLLAGAPGVGKTAIAVRLAAMVSTGCYFPTEESRIRVRPGETILFCGEDDIPRVIAPNLMACDADPSRVLQVGMRTEDGKGRPFDPSRDIKKLEQAILARTGSVRLVVLDPVISIADTAKDIYRANDIRAALAPVQSLAERTGVAVLGLTHFLKNARSQGSSMLDSVIGSQAWGAVARMVLGAVEVGGERRLLRVKSSWGPSGGGFAYSLKTVTEKMPPDVEGQRIEFGHALEGTADMLGRASDDSDRDAPAREEAADWLRAHYADAGEDGEAWGATKTAGREAGGFTEHTLRRARAELKGLGLIESKKSGHGGWCWRAVCHSAGPTRH